MSETGTKKKKILIVEDEPIIGQLCRRVLVAEGFEVNVVDNGLVAKETASSEDYDLCISDIRLPGITGIQLFKHWQKSNHNLANKLVFITGDTLSNNIQDFLNNSGRPCVLKPFTTEELLVAVNEALV